jgi:hypothetical protein
MRPLTVINFGTEDYIKRYSATLEDDCRKFGYNVVTERIGKQANIGQINYQIYKRAVEYIENNREQRICFLDPECRIKKPIPTRWLDSHDCVVFYKHKTIDSNQAVEPKFTYEPDGRRIPCRITGQPMFLSSEHLPWLRFNLKMIETVSDLANKQFCRCELFIETALRFTQTKTIDEEIIYDPRITKPHLVIKGGWDSDETIIQHPSLQTYFGDLVKANVCDGDMITEGLMYAHSSSVERAEEIHELCWKEKINDWIDVDDWQVHPALGLIKHKDYSKIMYHYVIDQKIFRNITTKQVKNYLSEHQHRNHEEHTK